VPALAPLVIAEAAIVCYWATVGRAMATLRPLLVAVALGGGLVSLIGQAVAVSADRALPMQALTIASFLSSAALLGGACTAMILGHWYLIIPSMQVSHLQSIIKLHVASMLVRIVVVVAAVLLGIAMWQPGMGPSFGYYITSIAGIFFWQRVLFGLAGPALLSYLTWETAKIRSTQSATGILYVDFFTVVVGEVLAKYLLLATRVPV
jgi:protein NrfD